MDRVALIANPRAGRNRVARELPRLLEVLKEAGVTAQVFETGGPGHATTLARSAAEDGYATVVAVGGDGTVNEVVNGLIVDDQPVGSAALGVVAAGSGADFNRSWHLPAHAGSALQGVSGPTAPLDVCRLTYEGTDGRTVRYFVNVAETGMAAETVRLAERLPRWLGRSRYLIAFWPSLIRFRRTGVTVTVDGSTQTASAHNALIANARYFGGGMQISPGSDPGDGVVELQVNVGPKRQALTLIPKIYRGTHLPDPRILEAAGTAGRIESDRPLLVEADGEVLGHTPLEFTVLPGVLRIRVAASD